MVGLAFSLGGAKAGIGRDAPSGKRVGIIGLDTSHSVAFTKALNAAEADPKLKGYKVVAAYPYGSKTIESSAKRIPGYIKEVQEHGVKIVDSISELLEHVDVVLLETNDGRLHLEQALPVFKSGKRLFIDKPIAASFADAAAIFQASAQYKVPVFSSSSLRYVENIPMIRSGNLIGPVTGADTFSPAVLEPSHPDLFWYGVHGVEMLYAIMGMGCERVTRVHHANTDIVVGIWTDGRTGTFRGTRTGKNGYGGTAYGEKGHVAVSEYNGYNPLLYKIVDFFETGEPPVDAAETLELFAFMEAADESKRQGGKAILIRDILGRE
ncbi:Gfo/Idh/MocA family oxidoreductase [Parapedobacter tibetensis]|uniref:Gfo/Idh/MocA family oxidoreductase n=1 Tax=Parapedobacter tibetensis TaxID=2972951 RepID=UPI00214DD9D6|nr:Gfo/Idh/MocA family oxidoreductase [Parapedobacter tibetensis]